MQVNAPLDAIAIAAYFKALSEPLRVQVIESLRQQEMCVCDLCDRLGTSQSKALLSFEDLAGSQLHPLPPAGSLDLLPLEFGPNCGGGTVPGRHPPLQPHAACRCLRTQGIGVPLSTFFVSQHTQCLTF
jgi:hypothetical protein